MSNHLLSVEHLKTVFKTPGGIVRAVDDASFYVDEGEIIGIVGESGSGKSVSMLSILKLISMPPGEIQGGKALFDGVDMLALASNSPEMRKIRGGGISMIFQEPMTSLNPVLTIGKQITESIILHLGLSKEQARQRAIDLLNQVGIPDAQTRIDYYPTQFSGGMRQRIMIAMAMSCNPRLIIADEATTALDVTTQEQILELLKDIVKKSHTALILITHNLSIVARYAERIYVMYAGNVMEEGKCDDVFEHPSHPYTIGLLNAVPRLNSEVTRKLATIPGLPANPISKTQRCPFFERCWWACEKCDVQELPSARDYEDAHQAFCWRDREEFLHDWRMDTEPIHKNQAHSPEILVQVQNLSKYFPVTKGITHRKVGDVKALDDVSFTIHRGETLGLVGESGCGKTTLAKTLLRLYDPSGGQILFDGQRIDDLPERKLKDFRRHVQFIFQDPYGSLDPRQSAGSVVGEAIRAQKHGLSSKEYEAQIDELFSMVGLDPSLKDRAPHEFSGGQRQRLCIASALASGPSFVICDEPISALDVSIQAQIINLLMDLKEQKGLTYLFIAHDLSVVRHISDRIVVMYLGKVVEISRWDQLYRQPLHPYTQALLSAIPTPDPKLERQRKRTTLQGEVPSLTHRPQGCIFHPRCPYATERCSQEAPEMRQYDQGHFAACFQIGEPTINQQEG